MNKIININAMNLLRK